MNRIDLLNQKIKLRVLLIKTLQEIKKFLNSTGTQKHFFPRGKINPKKILMNEYTGDILFQPLMTG